MKIVRYHTHILLVHSTIWGSSGGNPFIIDTDFKLFGSFGRHLSPSVSSLSSSNFCYISAITIRAFSSVEWSRSGSALHSRDRGNNVQGSSFASHRHITRLESSNLNPCQTNRARSRRPRSARESRNRRTKWRTSHPFWNPDASIYSGQIVVLSPEQCEPWRKQTMV
jgi:hypothetical protein